MITFRSAKQDRHQVTVIAEQLRRSVPGGIGTYVRELVRAVCARDDEFSHRLRLFASRAATDPDPLADLGATVCTSIFPGPVMTRLWERGLLGHTGGGLVHAPSLAFPPTDDALVVTVHDLAFRELPEAFTPHGRRWHERALRRAAGQAQHFVVPSPEVARQLLDAGVGIATDRVSVIAEGADHLGAGDDRATTELLHRLGVGGKFILSVGTIEPRKNIERLVRAFSTVRTQLDGPYVLLLCGPAGWLTDVPTPEGVVFAGHVTDGVLAGLYERCSLMVYVPLAEGFGLPVVEAMHHGAVVLSSTVPSAVQGSLVVDPLDLDSIADGLVRAIGDGELRRALVSSALAYVHDLTWAKAAEAHVRLWRQVAGR